MTTLNKNNKVNAFDIIEEKGLCAMDKICVFCSIMTDGWNSFCPRCKEYKGIMRLPEAIEYYGEEIIGY